MPMIDPGLRRRHKRQRPNKERGKNAEQQAENNSEGVRAHDHTETAKHVESGHCRCPGIDQINHVNVAQTQST